MWALNQGSLEKPRRLSRRTGVRRPSLQQRSLASVDFHTTGYTPRAGCSPVKLLLVALPFGGEDICCG